MNLINNEITLNTKPGSIDPGLYHRLFLIKNLKGYPC
jgi:hypothetical protein